MNRQLNTQENNHERGYVLITSILIIAILTIIGTAAWFKTNVQMKVSSSVLETEQALAAAKSGLEANYAYWAYISAGQTQFTTTASDVTNDATASGIYIDALTPTSLANLETLATGTFSKTDSDNLISTTAGIRVYNITDSGTMVETASSNWATGSAPQVAVWASSYTIQTEPTYPYTAPNTAACANCGIVIYSLGRSGNSRRLIREFQAVVVAPTLQGVSAMTNAPAYRNWQDMCDGTRTGTGTAFAGKTEDGRAVTWRAGEIHNGDDILLEVTQAEYDLTSYPSGVALVSNTNLGGEGKNFRKGTSSTTITSFDSVPMIAYAGHGTTTADTIMRVDEATRNMDNSTPAVNMPATPHKLPKNLMKEPLLGETDEVTYFPVGNPNGHLFDLDAYRWGAEQFTYQGSGNAGNGKYAAKAEALRTAMGVAAPVTGRINMAEFEYNIANGIPMFGMTRVMYPVYDQGALGNCAALGGASVHGYDTQSPTDSLTDSGSYNGSVTTLDSDGGLGSSAKLIAYGSIFFDFFIDMDGDGFFDPADGERLINAFEAVDARMELEVAEYINPALPEITSPVAFNTAAGGTLTVGSSSEPVNLASPTGGWFPISESRIPASSTDSQGQMQAADALVTAANQMMPNSDGGAGKVLSTSGAPAIYTTYKTRLDYYYRLMRATAKQSDANSWPINPVILPANLTDNICIGVADCAVGVNQGDAFHTLFPSGYYHGWKVSFAALNLTAAEWNSIFSNLPALAATADDGSSGYNHGNGTRPKGSPFNTSESGSAIISDNGFTRAKDATDLQANQNTYYSVTAHASGYALLDSAFKDIPGQIYAGGLVDIHKHNNMSGVIYTPGPLEWETGHFPGATGYVNAAIITGFGTFTESDGTTKVILVYDNQAVDNIPTVGGAVTALRRFAWQELK